MRKGHSITLPQQTEGSHNLTSEVPTLPVKAVSARQLEDSVGVTGMRLGTWDYLEDPFRIDYIKCIKKIHARIDQISGNPYVLKELDLTKYTQLSYKSSETLTLIPNKFWMLHVDKYDITTNPRDAELLQEFNKIPGGRMFIPSMPDEWAAKDFTKGLNPLNSDASWKLKENFTEFKVAT
ncbi:hypothetical protein HAX54_014969 [Datura stramonium]|uniref:Uncharacterized protein n=1 Tax=Datura stramonium TaxID=4076 RepID=A0ABS8TNV5_DATST|nr:hypothetical protein [Datura stramonium]